MGIAIDAEADLDLAEGEYSLGARFDINLHGLDRDTAQWVAEEAEGFCPKAVRGRIDVSFNLI